MGRGEPVAAPHQEDATATVDDLLACRRFRAMNTDVQVFARDPRHAASLAGAEHVFYDVEARFSRFRDDSELSRFNSRTSAAVAVSRELFDLLALAARYHDVTGGIFEPAVLPQLEACGYDRSFEHVAERFDRGAPATVAGGMSVAQLRFDAPSLTVMAPDRLRIDLGGIGKGHAVDAALALLRPLRDALVDAGGDIAATGDGPGGDGWLVGVADPRGGRDLALVRLRDGALATSTVALRRWRRGGRWLHHLIDPRTGEPARTDAVSVSVLAGTATEADVFAKTALILGVVAGERFLEDHGAAGLFVTREGACVRTPGWPGEALETRGA